MKWEGQRESDNIDDRRGDDGGDDGGGGGGFGFGARHIGIGTIAIALIGGWVLGVNPLQLLGALSGGGGAVHQAAPRAAPRQPGTPVQATPQEQERVHFVRLVLGSTEDVWTQIFQQHGWQYRKPMLSPFRGSTQTACGQGAAAMGPFYCPGDQHVFIDLGFYDTLRDRLGAPGDFAQAYVIAHEVGHHVQNLLGISAKVQKLRQQSSEVKSNALSVRMELQADCLAGVWGHHANGHGLRLEAGDLESALNAATQIGDDTLQRHARGTVVPESFTHGSGAQRVRWFRQGFDSGELEQCDTFKARDL